MSKGLYRKNYLIDISSLLEAGLAKSNHVANDNAGMATIVQVIDQNLILKRTIKTAIDEVDELVRVMTENDRVEVSVVSKAIHKYHAEIIQRLEERLKEESGHHVELIAQKTALIHELERLEESYAVLESEYNTLKKESEEK